MNANRIVWCAVWLACGLMMAGPMAAAQEQAAKGAPAAEALGWHLGCQAYSFKRFTFYEAVDKVASLGLHYIEAYPGQTLSAERPDVKFGPNMGAEVEQEVLAKLKAAGVQLVNYGVTGLMNDEAQCREVFEFAKRMGIETICSEPPEDAFDTIEPLCEEYGINVAIHNHPAPSRYWNPDKVLEVCAGRSERIGACADTGHWMRSGINPLEALKKLEGRIISFHFKDLNQMDKDAHDVPWGTGQADVQALLTEIRRQGIEAVFSVEYEHNWENSLPEIAESVVYFDKVAAQLAKAK
ncbi:MAG: sugar phosphate isomerase/epimerase [Candidatus Hydrogenedentes bacterium]|nr:sugar phosphate isomerase/epimerase [Candidatus Hydrogenedentota bacterium]